MQGADIEGLRRLAAKLQTAGEQFGTVIGSTGRQLHQSPWRGVDAQRFRVDWDTRLQPQMRAASTLLRDTARSLLANAEEQENASSAHGGVGTVGGGGTARLDGVGGAVPASIPMPSPGGGGGARPPSVDDLTATQRAYFEQLTGGPPRTSNDAALAQMVDPATTQARYHGHDSVVRVWRMPPQPGRGQVQTNWFIPGERGWNLPHADYGDDRGFDPYAAPDQSRVTMLVDYDRGIIVARQNPSVSVGGMAPWLVHDSSEVRVAAPNVSPAVGSNGLVTATYDAANPFAPPGAGSAGWSVHGAMAIEPGSGPATRVHGDASDFPAMEVYSRGSDGVPNPLYQYDVTQNQFGPLAGLPTTHEFDTNDPASSTDAPAPTPTSPPPAPSPDPQPAPAPTPSPRPQDPPPVPAEEVPWPPEAH